MIVRYQIPKANLEFETELSEQTGASLKTFIDNCWKMVKMRKALNEQERGISKEDLP